MSNATAPVRLAPSALFPTLGVPHCVPVPKAYQRRSTYLASRYGRTGRSGYVMPASMALRDARAAKRYAFAPRFAEGFGSNRVADDGTLWVYSPESAGLRFVGYADEIAGLRHNGWYTDSEGFSETARGVVYQMAARGGRPVYVPGLADPWNNGSVILSFGDAMQPEYPGGCGRGDYEFTPSDALDAALLADGIAERFAERERDYQVAYDAGARVSDLKEEAEEARAEFLELRAAARDTASKVGAQPVLCGAVRHRLESLVKTWRECKAKAEALAEEFGDCPGFFEGAND